MAKVKEDAYHVQLWRQLTAIQKDVSDRKEIDKKHAE